MTSSTLAKPRPLLCNSAVVEALLAGRKSMTRRELKISSKRMQALPLGRGPLHIGEVDAENGHADFWFDISANNQEGTHPTHDTGNLRVTCPFGKIGDLLWVRESWAWSGLASMPPSIAYHEFLRYKVPGPGKTADPAIDIPHPSIFMPRWASRMWLRITGIDVQWLQDISHEDCLAEGVYKGGPVMDTDAGIELGESYWMGSRFRKTPKETFAWFWDSLYGPGAWNSNPIVWVIKFERVQKENV